jgi:D-alanine-D-alanine ligase
MTFKPLPLRWGFIVLINNIKMPNQKIKVGILFGGKSAEHEVSLQSAKNVFDAIDKSKYEPILIGIDKSGKWLLNQQSEFLLNANDPKLIKLNQASDQVVLAPQSNGQIANLSQNTGDLKIDVVFPILHGPFGEDGTVQGLLKLANIPFVGASVLGSAVGMDKEIMKKLLRDAGIKIGKFITLRHYEKLPDYTNIINTLGSPFFIKPANMGSSVGISKIHNETEYLAGVKNAFQYDTKIILEEYIAGREIECAILGNENPQASVVGEVIANHEFYSYEAKYIDEKGAKLEIPAKIPTAINELIRTTAIQVFKILNCEGLARVDFFLKENGDIIVNELNTMPGFTRISMYPKLWEASGISYTDLVDKLIQLAIERFEIESKIKTSYVK